MSRKPASSSPTGAPAMPASAEFVQVLRGCGVPAVLSGAGPAVLALTTDSALPAEALEFGAAHGFAVDEMAVGRPVEWGPGDGRDASGGRG